MRKLYQPVYPDVYVPRGAEPTAEQRARAAWLWSGGRAVVAGQSAASAARREMGRPAGPAELVSENRRPPRLIVVHSDMLLRDEVTDVEGIAVTNAARTAFDIGRRTSRSLAVQRLDALANATDLKTADVDAVIAQHKGARGIRRLRRILSLVDGGSESPQESRTRLVLIDAGLPKPETQIRVCNEYGDFVGRVDMGWREWLVAVEYDGSQHWTDPQQRRRDIERLAELADCGWIIVRVSSDMLRSLAGHARVAGGSALRSRGWTADPAPSVNLATLRSACRVADFTVGDSKTRSYCASTNTSPPSATIQLAKLPTRKYSVMSSYSDRAVLACLLRVDLGEPDDALGCYHGRRRGELAAEAEAQNQQPLHRPEQSAALEPIRRLRLACGPHRPDGPQHQPYQLVSGHQLQENDADGHQQLRGRHRTERQPCPRHPPCHRPRAPQIPSRTTQ